MEYCIGIITVRDSDYHPNGRLLTAASQAGHRGMLIHPYRTWPLVENGGFGLTGEAAARLPDVVLPRQGAQIGDACLALIRQYERLGVPLVNGAAAVSITRDQFLTLQALSAAGIACPDTVFINDAAGFFDAVARLGGYPVVAKTPNGRQGKGVLRLTDADDARQRVLPHLDRVRGLLVQRYLPPEGRQDYRALVIGGAVAATARLTPPPGDFRANFYLGRDIRACRLDPALAAIAVAAAAAAACDVAGVDMMVTADGRCLVVEVNHAPGFRGLEGATGLDIAARIVRYAIGRADKRSSITEGSGT